MKKIQTIIARYLDWRYPDACHTNLILWTMSYQSFSETFGCNGNWKSQICRWDNDGTPYAYCNKCALSGRYFIGHPMPVETKVGG